MRKILLFSITILGINLQAQIGGKNSFSFLDIPATARSSSLGGSSISARDDDPNLISDNPSILDSNLDNRFSFNYVNFISDINAGNFMYSKSLKTRGAIGVGVQFLGYGQFTGAEANGQKTGEFKAGDYAINGSYGTSFDSIWYLGSTIKFIYSNYETFQRTGLGTDLSGGFWSRNRLFNVNLALTNFGYALKKNESNEREKLPFEIAIGLSRKIPKAPLRFHLQFQNLQKFDLVTNDPNFEGKTNKKTGEVKKSAWSVDNYMRHIVFGADIILHKNFVLTMAYNHKRKKELAINGRGSAGLSFGAQVKIKRIQFNYAYSSYFVSGNSHHIGLTTNLNSYFRKG